MSIIFPGNYVCHLNAYRDQGVSALPGVDFFRAVGTHVLHVDQASGATYDLVVLSPDMRTDDAPRLNKPFIIPKGAAVYRTAINGINLKTVASGTLTVSGVTPAAEATADSDGLWGDMGAWTPFNGLGDATSTPSITRLAGDTAVTAVASGALDLISKNEQTAILVEVDYFMDAPAPDRDDVNLPYQIEAGQGV